MILKFKGMSQQWMNIEQVIPGVKQTLKTIIQKFLKHRLGGNVYKESKNVYCLKSKEIPVIVIHIKKNDDGNKYLQLNFVKNNPCINNNIQSIDINSIEDFSNVINQWSEDFIRNPLPKKARKGYIRKEIYSIEEILSKTILDNTNSKSVFVNFDGDMISMISDRYRTFVISGIKCVCCGLEAKYFAKEKNPTSSRFHFNLYGIDDENKEIMFTKDHIIPKSKGGINELTNYQTMCSKCNSKKGDSL